MNDRGRQAGAEARRVGQDIVAPDLDRTIKRRQRARIVTTVASSALVVVLLIGAGALFMRTDSDDLPVGTSTTTTAPNQTTTTLTTTTTVATTTTEVALPTEPVYGGVVTLGSGTEMVFGTSLQDGTFLSATINPLFDQWNASDVARLTVPGAYRMDPGSGEPKPWVLEEIPRLSNGGIVMGDGRATVTYEIRSQAQWADGTPISAADFSFTHALIMRDDLPIDGNLREIHSLIDSDSLTGEGATVTFDLTAPNPRYERLFPWLVPAHAVDPDTFADDWNDQLWLSGGPFIFDSFTKTANPEDEPSLFFFSRNDNYWEVDDQGNQLPFLDGIEVKAFGHGSMGDPTLAAWFTSESVDAMLGGVVSRYFVDSLGDPDEEGFVVSRSWDSLYEMVGFNLGDGRLEVNPDSLNEHLLYRQAVLSAIDRTAIADAVGGPVVSVGSAASPGLQSGIWDQYEDQERTTALLSQLGSEIGRDFAAEPPMASLISSTGDSTIVIGEAIAEQLQASGVQVDTEFSWDFFSVWLPEGQLDVYTLRLFAGDGLADLANVMSFFDPFRSEGERLFDWSSVGEPAQRFSTITAEAQNTLDPDRLSELLIEAETILADNAVIYPLVLRQVFYLPYWPERVQGIVPHQGWDTQTAAWWWSPAAGERN